jgi:8-amino-7-oxononanoate synthase
MSSSSETASAGIIGDLAHVIERRREAGLFRTRRVVETMTGPHVRVDGRDVIAFASNDYLGLAADPRIIAAMQAALGAWGAGAGASHLVSGHLAPHAKLEGGLAAWAGPCAGAGAVTFSTGYLANLAVLTALAERTDAIFADRLNHASLNDGALLSRAQLVRYAHGDIAALRARLAATHARRRIIATDAVFSMDGDVAPLAALLDLAHACDALLVVDDAHGFGVLGGGRGTLAELRLASERIVLIGTLGKAAGIAGAFVSAHPTVIEAIVQLARPYVYTTAAPPALAAGLCASLACIRTADRQREHLFALIDRLRAGCAGLPWTLAPSSTAIQPLIVGDNADALALAGRLWSRGLWVPAIRPPTVPAGTARLRISLSAAHTAADVDALLAALHAIARELASRAAMSRSV